jgi:hypothetical protein
LKGADVYHFPALYPPLPCAPHVFTAIVSLKDFVIVSHWNSVFKGILPSEVFIFMETNGQG